MSDRQIAEWCFAVFVMYILAAMAHATMTLLVILWEDTYSSKEVTD